MFVLGNIRNRTKATSRFSGFPVGKPNLHTWPPICTQWTEHLRKVRHLARIHSHKKVDHEAVRVDLKAVEGDSDHIVLKHESVDSEHHGNRGLRRTIPDGCRPLRANGWLPLRYDRIGVIWPLSTRHEGDHFLANTAQIGPQTHKDDCSDTFAFSHTRPKSKCSVPM